MSYLIRASFVLPYEPALPEQDRVHRLILEKQFRQVRSSARNVIAVSTFSGAENGRNAGKSLASAIGKALDCDVKGRVSVAEIVDEQVEPVSIARPAQKRTVRVCFSATFRPGEARGKYTIFVGGDKIACEESLVLPSATTVNEAQYDTVDSALARLHEWAEGAGLNVKDLLVSVVSAAELVVKQARGQWSVKEPGLMERCGRVVKMASVFGEAAWLTPSEAREAA
jgi:hypothetical protein